MTSTVGFQLDEHLHERLKALGKQRESSVDSLMKIAIEQYLDEQEAYERERAEDQRTWDHYLATGEGTDNDTMIQWMKDHVASRQQQCIQ